MAVVIKTVKTKLKSVRNVRKITKTMEMVSASKMRRAVHEVLLSRGYVDAAWQMIGKIAAGTTDPLHPLLCQHRTVKRRLIVLFSTNRGLCGGFNSQLVLRTLQYLAALPAPAELLTEDWIVIGKKGAINLARRGKNVTALFDKPELASRVADILPISKMALDGFSNETYDQVILAYTDYISALKQVPAMKVLLPLVKILPETVKPAAEADQSEFIFEPSPAEVLNQFLPHLITLQIYQALLESNAAEHSARVAAMASASEATADMIDSLTLMYNQARQASITREIAEIAGARAALG